MSSSPVVVDTVAIPPPPDVVVHGGFRAAFEAKRTEPDLGITEAEAREIRAISEHHFEEMSCGLDKVGPQWDDEEGEEVAA